MKAKPGPVDLFVFYLCIFILNKLFKLFTPSEGRYLALKIYKKSLNSPMEEKGTGVEPATLPQKRHFSRIRFFQGYSLFLS